MKKEPTIEVTPRNKSISTKAVYCKNNQVYIKNIGEVEDWYPINFQWIPVIE